MIEMITISTIAQIDELVSLAKEIWFHHFTPIIGKENTEYMVKMCQSKEAITKDIENGYSYEFISLDGKNAGYISYNIENDAFFVSKFYVHHDFRGKKLGRFAMNHMETIARKNCTTKMWLDCNRENFHSLDVYKTLGFVITQTLDRPVGDFIAEDYILEKKISQIKNVIFDMGNVLVKFDPYEIIGKYVDSKDDVDLIIKALFESGIWQQLDVGESEAVVISQACDLLPDHLHKAVANTLAYYPIHMTHNADMPLLVERIKKAGYNVYLLSNVGFKFYEYYKDIKAIGLMDGFIASADCGCKKPDPKIYQMLFDKFNLIPEECFFIDDLEENINAGMRCGMTGHVFNQNMAKLEKSLADNNIII